MFLQWTPPKLLALARLSRGPGRLIQATQVSHVFAAWALMGLAMCSGLYEAEFATVVRLHGQNARCAITGITLFVGFASTAGWRGACLSWAAMHLVIGLPLNMLPPRAF